MLLLFKCFHFGLMRDIFMTQMQSFINSNEISKPNMKKVKRSEYIQYSRTIVRKLFSCWGKGSLYPDNLLSGLPEKSIGKEVLDALYRQEIVCRKKHKHGWKYYLNKAKRDKIKQIVKERDKSSILVLLLKL